MATRLTTDTGLNEMENVEFSAGLRVEEGSNGKEDVITAIAKLEAGSRLL